MEVVGSRLSPTTLGWQSGWKGKCHKKSNVFLLETDSYSEIHMLGAPQRLPSGAWALTVD